MPPENQKNLATDELLDDIRYVNMSNEAEIQRVGEDLLQHLAEVKLPKSVTNALIENISTQLGQLAVKVKMTEKAIQSLQAEQKHNGKPGKNTEIQNGFQTNEKRFPANQLVGGGNLLPLESSTGGVSYRWSGAGLEIPFQFMLNRNNKLEMQIRLYALIKPEYSKLLKVFIDGQHIKHRFYLDGSLFVVSCTLPVSASASQTEIKIQLPGTHSPSELGGGPDHRKLGIAISEIRFCKPSSGLSYLLKRLRLKK